jgi:hypothetical protein
MKRLLILLAKGLWLLFVAAIALWFFPLFFQKRTDPELAAYYEEKHKRRRASLLRRAFEIWQRKENQTRSQRAWENRNDFFRKGK